MRPNTLNEAFRGLSISPKPSVASFLTASPLTRPQILSRAAVVAPSQNSHARLFSSTPSRHGSWLEPSLDRTKKMMKGRCRVPTGGSTKGTTVIWGDYGLRMRDHHRRVSAKQLKTAEDTIKARLRGQKYRLYKRVACNIGVFVSGNEIRMGKGKGSFDHWAARMAVNQVAFEIKGVLHEAVVKDAFRLAGQKLPGQWEFVHKGEPPIVGITKLENGVTLEDLKRPRRKVSPEQLLKEAPTEPTKATGGSPPSSS